MLGPSRIEQAVRVFASGLRYGYPICCVCNYAFDSLLGVPSGLSRGERSDPSLGTYVPCGFHKQVTKSLPAQECLQLLKSGFAVEHLNPDDILETRVNGKVVSSLRVPFGVDAVYLSQIRLRGS